MSLPSLLDLKILEHEYLETKKHNLNNISFPVIHDLDHRMFKIQLDHQGNCAALCYLPTQFQNIIEFYHIEIPTLYRHQGLGDLLLYKAFQWVKKSNLLVVPTCPFVRKYLETRFPDFKNEGYSCIILSEKKQP